MNKRGIKIIDAALRQASCEVKGAIDGVHRIRKALNQPSQKDNSNDLLADQLKLHALLFKNYIDTITHAGRLPPTATNQQLYDSFLLSLKSVPKI